MALLTIKNIGTAGFTDVEAELVAAAGGGDTFANDLRTCAILKNASVGAITVTAATQQASTQGNGFGKLTNSNYTLVIPAGKIGITPFFEQCFTNTSGLVTLTYSGVTTLTVGAFKFPPLSTPQ